MAIEVIECKTKDQVVDHFIIRKIVFVDEQNITLEEEYDWVEKERILFLVNYNGIHVGTARLKLGDNFSKIERVCILKEYRNKGVGKVLIEELINYSHNKNIYEIHLGAQTQAMGFYEKCGFVKYGDLYYDANIPHYNMKKES